MARANRTVYNEKTDTLLIGDNGRFYKSLFNKFKREYSSILRYGTYWEPHGYQEIQVTIPNRGVLIYNETGTSAGEVTWVEHYDDIKAIKREEREKRPDMYQRFLSEIDIYQKETGVTQGQIAETCGISRQSINKYMSGIVIPKVSTMRKIADSLGIDI